MDEELTSTAAVSLLHRYTKKTIEPQSYRISGCLSVLRYISRVQQAGLLPADVSVFARARQDMILETLITLCNHLHTYAGFKVLRKVADIEENHVLQEHKKLVLKYLGRLNALLMEVASSREQKQLQTSSTTVPHIQQQLTVVEAYGLCGLLQLNMVKEIDMSPRSSFPLVVAWVQALVSRPQIQTPFFELSAEYGTRSGRPVFEGRHLLVRASSGNNMREIKHVSSLPASPRMQNDSADYVGRACLRTGEWLMKLADQHLASPHARSFSEPITTTFVAPRETSVVDARRVAVFAQCIVPASAFRVHTMLDSFNTLKKLDPAISSITWIDNLGGVKLLHYNMQLNLPGKNARRASKGKHVDFCVAVMKKELQDDVFLHAITSVKLMLKVQKGSVRSTLLNGGFVIRPEPEANTCRVLFAYDVVFPHTLGIPYALIMREKPALYVAAIREHFLNLS
jgi:hypothetical protein